MIGTYFLIKQRRSDLLKAARFGVIGAGFLFLDLYRVGVLSKFRTNETDPIFPLSKQESAARNSLSDGEPKLWVNWLPTLRGRFSKSSQLRVKSSCLVSQC